MVPSFSDTLCTHISVYHTPVRSYDRHRRISKSYRATITRFSSRWEKRGEERNTFHPGCRDKQKSAIAVKYRPRHAHFVRQRMQSLFETELAMFAFRTIRQKLRPRSSLRSTGTGPTETFISSSIGKCMRELRSIRGIPKGVFDASG